MMNFDKYIHAMIEKDQTAFEIIYKHTNKSVYAMIISIVKNHDLTEDLMQDTYMKMLKNIHSYNPKYKFKNWLLTIAKNIAIDAYNQRKREINIEIEDFDHWLKDEQESMDSILEADYYLSLLNDEERQIVLLRIVGNMKHKDIASLLNKPLGTITWTYKEAIEKMRYAKEASYHEKK
jgi:RNA polymerase sigma-70 factor, ECF subfamily